MLTERERKILELHKQGLSDYKIARQLNVDPPSITKSRLNGMRKLQEAEQDLAWAEQIGIKIIVPETVEVRTSAAGSS